MTAILERPVIHGATDEFARRCFTPRGTDYLDPVELGKSRVLNLDLDPARIPAIPFSDDELNRARKLNQFLVCHSDTMKTGKLVTMKELHGGCDNKLGEGKLFYDTAWYQKEPLFIEDAIVSGWYLVGKEVIPGSTGIDYLAQTQVLADYLVNEVYQGEEMPEVYTQAVEEFKSRKKALEKLIRDDWEEGGKQTAELQLNQLFRESAVQAVYNDSAYFEVNDKYLLPSHWAWTKTRSSDGYIVRVGDCDPGGVVVGSDYPGYSLGRLGVRFSRGGVPNLKS